MKKSSLKKFIDFSFREFEFLDYLPFKYRLISLLGLVCFAISAILLTHLSCKPYFSANEFANILIISLYIFIAISFIISSLPFIFSKLIRFKKLFFVISIVFGSIGGAIIGSADNYLFRQTPPTNILLLWMFCLLTFTATIRISL